MVGSMVAGAFAGTAEHIVMYPVDSVKVGACLFLSASEFGLGALTVERSFFPKNERNDQEQSHHFEKKRTLRTRS